MGSILRNNKLNQAIHGLLLGTSLCILSSCSENTGYDKDVPTASLEQNAKLQKILAQYKDQNTKKGDVAKGIDLMLAGNYDDAGKCLNRALEVDPTNAKIHLLNGINYQLQSRDGNMQQLDVARAGFIQALKFDPSLAVASLQLGRVYKTEKEYIKAQEEFSNTLLIDPKNQGALYELATTSYLMGDLKTARPMIERYVKRYPRDAPGLHSAAIIRAATGDAKGAQHALKNLRKIEGQGHQAQLAQQRVLDWKSLYDKGFITLADATSEAPIDLAATSPDPAATAPDPAGASAPASGDGAAAPTTPAAASSGSKPAAAVVIDAIIMRNSTNDGTSKGNNILENFSVTLEPGTHFYARGRGRGDPEDFQFSLTQNTTANPNTPYSVIAPINAGGSMSVSRLFSHGISFGSITYSLNIANVSRQTIQIVDRPSVTTVIGQKGEFFSGFEYVLGLAGQYGGTITRTPMGIELSVTPTAYDPVTDIITMELRLFGSLISDESTLSNNVTQSFSEFQVSRLLTTVTMKMGETLMLGGIQTRTDEQTKKGFPGLSDIPLIQYLFSNMTTSSERKLVTFLITPRLAETAKKLTQLQFVNEKKKQRHVLSELEMRNKDWFSQPFPNWVMQYRMMENLYREFRTGDVPEIHWEQRLDNQFDYLESFFYF